MLEHETISTHDLGSSGIPVSARGLLAAIFRHRTTFFLIAGSVILATVVWVLITPRRYMSEMVLLVQNARGNEAISSGEIQAGTTGSDVSEEQLNSEVAVLNSDDILSEIVNPGWHEATESTMSRQQLLAHERAVSGLRGRLDVSPVRTSHAINIKLAGTSPEIARQDLTALLQVFLKKQKDLGRLPGASKVFTQQAAEYRKNLEAARRELAQYQNEHGFVELGEHERSTETRLRDLQAAQRDADVQISELEQRVKADQGQLSLTPPRHSTQDQSAPAVGTVDQLNVLLVTLKNRRTELLTKFTPNDRLVKEVDQQIADTAAGIQQATVLSAHQVTSDVNPLWEAANRDLANSEVTLAGMRARKTSITAQVSALQSGLNQVEMQSGEYDLLQQRVTELEAGYRTFQQKRDTSLMSDLMDQQQWLNVAVVQYPTLSLTPSHPRPSSDIPLGVLTALVLGGCAVFFLEATRQQVSTPAELELLSRYPVLATIPVAALPGAGDAAVATNTHLQTRTGKIYFDDEATAKAVEVKSWPF